MAEGKMIRLGYQLVGATGGGGNPAIADNMSTHTSHYIFVRQRKWTLDTNLFCFISFGNKVIVGSFFNHWVEKRRENMALFGYFYSQLVFPFFLITINKRKKKHNSGLNQKFSNEWSYLIEIETLR